MEIYEKISDTKIRKTTIETIDIGEIKKEVDELKKQTFVPIPYPKAVTQEVAQAIDFYNADIAGRSYMVSDKIMQKEKYLNSLTSQINGKPDVQRREDE
jgi:hypothetical protein